MRSEGGISADGPVLGTKAHRGSSFWAPAEPLQDGVSRPRTNLRGALLKIGREPLERGGRASARRGQPTR